MIVCAGKNEIFEFATPIGVGLVESAINLTSILERLKTTNKLPLQIVFIGTAGIYKDGEILKIYESSLAFNHEPSQLLELSYSPISDELCYDKNSCNVSRETKQRATIVNSSNFITTSSFVAAKFSDLGYELENMELYSVLSVAKSFKIEAFGILCATNFCNEFAHKDFIKNHNTAKEKLEKYIKKSYSEKFF